MNTFLFPQKAEASFLWRGALTLLYTLFIFAMVPVFPTLWDYAFGLFPNVLEKFVFWLVGLVGVGYFAFFIYVRRNRDLLFYLWSAILFLAYYPLVYSLSEYPAERFHVAEYGVLSILAYRWLHVPVGTIWVYPGVLGYAFLVGTIDEAIQYFLPGRFFEFRDMSINWASALVATCLIAFVERARRKRGLKKATTERLNHGGDRIGTQASNTRP